MSSDDDEIFELPGGGLANAVQGFRAQKLEARNKLIVAEDPTNRQILVTLVV